MLQWNFFSEVSGFGKFEIKWSSNPHMKHVFGFWLLRSVLLLLELRELKGDLLWPLPFLCCLIFFQLGVNLQNDCTLIEKNSFYVFLTGLSKLQIYIIIFYLWIFLISSILLSGSLHKQSISTFLKFSKKVCINWSL